MSSPARPNAVVAPLGGEALRHLEESVLPRHLAACRWYAAKSAGLPDVRVVDAVELPLPAGSAYVCTVRAEPPGRQPQLYLLPLVLDPHGADRADDRFLIGGASARPWAGALRDAMGDDGFIQALLERLNTGAATAGLRFARTAALADQAPALGAAPLHRAGAEQSNTSVRVGDRAILKAFRKLEPGVHPEVEVTRFLTEVARFANTPRLLGWVEQPGAEAATTLFVLQELVPDAEDGWAHVTGRLRAALDAAAGDAPAADDGLLALMNRLGNRTAALHHALAVPTEDPAFRAEPVDDAVLEGWTEAVRRMAGTAVAALRDALPGLDPAVAARARGLIDGEAAILARIDALAPRGVELRRMRLHGDFHLGQTLVTDDDVFLIDFEGEPMRPMAERRAKHCPLRDVAGMLRSIAYAAATARRGLADGAGGAGEAWMARWEEEATRAFLAGYREAIAGCPGVPEDPAAADGLLTLFMLEKALYELGYELANRPDWLAIPLDGVLRLLEGAPAPRPLERLAERMGIETAYTDAAGRTVTMTRGTIRTVLRAMGVEAADDDAAEAHLAAIERDELSRALPPVVVRRVDRPPFGVPVTLAAGTGTLRWTLRTEDGDRREGTATVADLPLLRQAALDGRPVEVRRLDLPAPPPGYHGLRVSADGVVGETSLIAVPGRCHLPEALEAGRRLWGMAAQLYALRSASDWGVGDFGDLANLVEIAASRGAAVVGLNPLHALFLDLPDQASPYSPASRLFLHPLAIDATAVPELATSAAVRARIATPEFQEALSAARDCALVDYEAVTRLKLPILEALFAEFRAAAAPERRAAFEDFRRAAGAALERFCVFQALRERFAAEGVSDWRRWPDTLHDPASPAVAAFAADHRDRVDFYAWLQWIADGQLAAAAGRFRAHGAAIGLYRDLAVGAAGAGAETWMAPHVVVSAAHVGAPPDLFNPAGQDWGLPPFHPHALREDAYRPFIALVRANMRHAGALRIDHAMALQHTYWVPAGSAPADGAYVTYPMEDLLGILALESRRNRCLVIGEDLGTVPAGFRERMEQAGILSYRVLFFEWTEDGGFVGPDDYPYLALATAGSHDLATLRGWWQGRDIAEKERAGLYPDPGEAKRQRERRRDERGRLIDALRDAGLPLAASFGGDSPYDTALGQAVHAYLARTASAIAMVQLDDMTDEPDQINLPGSTDEYPNWRRKLSLTLEELADDPLAGALASIMAAARPLPAVRPAPDQPPPAVA
ncbi:4-alpha-glucanotransferase [Azospirillum sp. ST 5-10]|uniref:4-alpha-glucanotransferase n=1 Tax=unclassified Azospirillum TaxID=2630922 RepID=UPI003F4A234D